jgi:hypothetical protein
MRKQSLALYQSPNTLLQWMAKKRAAPEQPVENITEIIFDCWIDDRSSTHHQSIKPVIV